MNRIFLVTFLYVGIASLQVVDANTCKVGKSGADIVVNSTADFTIINLPDKAPACTLRDAIIAANTNQIVGGCDRGKDAQWHSMDYSNFVDQIRFDLPDPAPTIHLRRALPIITEAVCINGQTKKAKRLELDGSGILASTLAGPAHGLVITNVHTTIENMVINGFSGNGIIITSLGGDGHIVGPSIPETNPEKPVIVDPCGKVDCSGPDGPLGGFKGSGRRGDDKIPTIDVTEAAGYNYVVNNFIGTDSTGTIPIGNGSGMLDQAGIVVLSESNRVGTNGKSNVISGNRGHGIIVAGKHNEIVDNAVGTDAGDELDLGNQFDGVFVLSGNIPNTICLVEKNTIAHNQGNGISGGFNDCTASQNSIFENNNLGIDMGLLGVSPQPTPSNKPLAVPEITSVVKVISISPILYEVEGTISYPPLWKPRVELFHSEQCDPSGYGEGAHFLGSTQVTNGTSTFWMNVEIPHAHGVLTATATSTSGSGVTSEFSACVNNPSPGDLTIKPKFKIKGLRRN